ncbi:MAG TPA: ABC transporter permease [Gemmataceae bacterium]|nr:ABC transporter permease [Gemmataceae bacterium]
MLLLQNFITALEQLWANKLRSVLTVLGVIIAVMSTIVVVAVVQGFSGYVTTFLQGLGTNAMWVFPDRPPEYEATPSKSELVRGDIEEVEQTCSAVTRIAPLIIRQVKINYQNHDTRIELDGTTQEFQDIRSFFVNAGRCFGPIETDNHRQVCVLGRDVLRKLRADDGIVGDHVLIEGKRFRVLGVLEKKGSFLGNSLDGVILVPYTTALDMFPDAQRSLAFMAQAGTPALVPEAKAQITTALRRRHHLGPDQANDFIVQTQDEFLKQFNKISLVATTVLTGIVGVSLLVGGIGIMNVMLVSVTERTREIGLRKALGARRRDILAQFLTEAVVLSTAGGLIGILLGYGITYLAALHPDMVDVSVPYWAVLLGVGFSVVVGVLFGLLPAFKAAILQPIDALRYE